MGIIFEKDLKPVTCKCYKLDGDSLMCFRKGVIGTLSDKQEEELCSGKIILEPTVELKRRYERFVEAVHAAQERYYKENHDISKWVRLVGEELRKRGVEV